MNEETGCCDLRLAMLLLLMLLSLLLLAILLLYDLTFLRLGEVLKMALILLEGVEEEL